MDPQTYRETSLQTWDEMAPGWEDRREWLLSITGPINEWLVEQGDPQPGQTILDVAAGTGDLGFLAAERVGESGKVLCTDFSSEMVEAARRNGERRGLSNVEYRVLDAEQMDFEDDSVDGVLSRWSYMLMADPAAALRETRRVLRDGGTLAFAVWQTPDRNPWAAIPGMTLVQRGHMPPPEPGAPGMFAMGEVGPHRGACHGSRLRQAQDRGADVRVALRRRRPLGHDHPSGRTLRAGDQGAVGRGGAGDAGRDRGGSGAVPPGWRTRRSGGVLGGRRTLISGAPSGPVGRSPPAG